MSDQREKPDLVMEDWLEQVNEEIARLRKVQLALIEWLGLPYPTPKPVQPKTATFELVAKDPIVTITNADGSPAEPGLLPRNAGR